VASQPGTIVPANRLGQLLAEARLRAGTDLSELSRRSGGDFTVGELSDLEAGHRVLDDSLIRTVTGLYSIDCGPVIPQRAELTIDLDRNMVSASGKALPLSSSSRDHILDRYMSLVYVLRNREPGTSVPLRDEDLAILSASLAERSELIEEQLLRAMEPEQTSVSGLVDWFRSRLWVPGTGALVGVVSIGTLVFVAFDSPSAPGTSTTNTDDLPEPGTGTDATPVSRLAAAAAITLDPASPEGKGAAAEALLPFDWEETLPGWTINYRTADPTFRGLTFPYDKSIDLYVRDTDTPESLAGILAHELGHAIDVTHLDGMERQSWLDARGASDTQWWPDAYATDFQTGAGDFAESFAYWAVGDASSSDVAGTPTEAQVATLLAIVETHLR
jgi:hypothetical protein